MNNKSMYKNNMSMNIDPEDSIFNDSFEEIKSDK